MNLDSVFFISVFLPVAMTLYFLMPGIKAKNAVLLIVSFLFYSFGSLTGGLVLLAVCLVNFLLGLWLCRGKRRKLPLVLGVALNIALLALYKYLDFALVQVLGRPEFTLGLAVPIGISFFTFKCISYLVDTYRNWEQGTGNPFAFALYLSFFPTIVMGPIVRYRDFAPQLKSRNHSLEEICRGLRRFVAGLAKKLLIASTLGSMVDGIFGMDAGGSDIRLAWLAAIGYSLQLYFDFSGYIDMAIGIGRVFGFATTENFNHPYVASTVGGFWRRWHMSLTGWFKDYVYIPLGGNRKGRVRAGINKCIVFLLCGIWHGANWTFLLWGIWHGLFSLLESINVIPAKKLEKSRFAGHIYTLFIVIVGFVMFRATSVVQGFSVIRAMFTGFRFTATGTVVMHRLLTWETVAALVAGIALSVPVFSWVTAEKGKRLLDGAGWVLTLLLFVICIIKLAAGDFAPSIYASF